MTALRSPADYRLEYGTHATAADGRCAMEWVAHLASEPHSDQPDCISPVLRAICIALNDGLDDAPRQRLRPNLARAIGTAGDGRDPERAWLALDWLIRIYAPAWLTSAGAGGPARRLGALTPVTGETSLADALSALNVARVEVRALHTDTRPWFDTVRSTARETAWACGGAAAWAAARLAIGAGAGEHARAAPRRSPPTPPRPPRGLRCAAILRPTVPPSKTPSVPRSRPLGRLSTPLRSACWSGCCRSRRSICRRPRPR